MTASSLLRFSLVMLVGASGAAAQRPSRRQSTPQSKLPTATPYMITGTVVNRVNQSPVPHCRLTATPVARGSSANRQFPAPLDAVDCDEHGHFSVAVPSAGTWSLSASARGFVSQEYEEHQGYYSGIVLTAAKPAMEVQFDINPEAAITGVVVDEAGEPVRMARVSLQTVPAAGPGGEVGAAQTRSATQTDDRGMYELAHIAPGAYRVMVRAEPWYAAYQPRGQNAAAEASLDPSLDFTYPMVWFPGVDDPALAETITLHAGDARRADFRLTPVPSVHLRIVPPAASVSGVNGRAMAVYPMVQPIVPGGGVETFAPINVQTDAQGQVDVGGLAPGRYRVRLNGPNQQGGSSIVEVTAGATRTLDLASASAEAKVTLHFEGLADADSRGPEVNLVDAEGGGGSYPLNGLGGGGGSNFGRRGGRGRSADAGGDRTIEVPPGRYEVVLQDGSDLYLAGVTAKGAEAAGRYVTLPGGASTLTLRVASGRATLTGVATLGDKPAVAAVALLVPTTIDDPNSLRSLRRDQTNTDGSFDIAGVIPGQYILVVLDHGWEINWSDPATLRGYLLHGVPLDLGAGATVKQNIVAQAP